MKHVRRGGIARDLGRPYLDRHLAILANFSGRHHAQMARLSMDHPKHFEGIVLDRFTHKILSMFRG
jgi:hypothetical protein